MTSYLVTIEIDHYWTWLKMHARDERTATEKNQVLMFYPLGENSEKTFGGSIHNLPPPPVRSRIKWYDLTFDSRDH